MVSKRLTIRGLMILVAVVAITCALLPIAFRAVYPNTHEHIYYFPAGDTPLITIEF